MNKNRTWEDEDLRRAVAASDNYSETLRNLGLVPKGGNHATIKRYISKLDIDVGHFYTAPPKPAARIPAEDLFTQHSTYSSSHIKARMLKDLGTPDKCSVCGISDWHGTKLSLHVHHKNGVGDDNRPENLELLCPNCHSVTDTYSGKNVHRKTEQNVCIDCGRKIAKKSTRCRSCFAKSLISKRMVIVWPMIDELLSMLEEHKNNYSKLGRELGVSDNAIRKHLKVRGVQCPR